MKDKIHTRTNSVLENVVNKFHKILLFFRPGSIFIIIS